jgi:hypothetical protein
MLLNKKNKNGSINLLQVTGQDGGEIVSPFHPEFRNQIEDGIWPIVSTLINNGFYVVDSCQGHWDERNDDYSHFTIAFPTVESSIKFKKLISTAGLDFSIHTSWITVENEIKFVNNLYMTAHDNFIFAVIKILPNQSKLIRRFFTGLIRQRLLKKIKKIRYEHIN